MKNETFMPPIRCLLNIILICGIISGLFIGAPHYIKHMIKKWAEPHELEIDIDTIHFNWRLWKMPSIVFKEISIKNKGSKPVFTHIKAQNIFLDPNYSDFLKSYGKKYVFVLKIKTLKVFLINGDTLETDTIATTLNYESNVCKINNFNLTPLRVKLAHNSSSQPANTQLKGKSGNFRNEVHKSMW